VVVRGRRWSRRRGGAVAFLLVLLAVQTMSSASSRWVDGVRIPAGYRLVARHHPGTGVWHLVLRRSHPGEVLNVGVLQRTSPNALRVILSNGRVAGPAPRTERTSSMCRRVDCLVAVNGDFFTDAGAPVGGVVDGGEPVRSPNPSRSQFVIGPTGKPRVGPLQMAITLTSTYSGVPTGLFKRTPTSQTKTTPIDGLNVIRGSDDIVVYTPRYGPTTETKKGTELIARIVSPAGPLHTGVDTTVQLISQRTGGSSIPADGVVLSGQGDGAATLAALWRDVRTGVATAQATLRVNADPAAVESVGGKPVLVRDGKRVTSSRSIRAPRTMIGWTASGDVLMVTADGRGNAAGLTVVEAADLMRALGAVYALNLDGGGSTTFVLGGRVVNHPANSGYRERGVAVSVAIVPK